MVQALINIDDNTNRVLNIIKAKYDLRDKGEAVERIVRDFVEYEQEPELKADFIAKMKLIEKQKSIPVDDFSKRYSLS